MRDRGHPTGRRGAVLQLLRRADSPLGIAEIAEQLGVHHNTVRFHLETLVETGHVERVPARVEGRGRPRQLFQPVRRMDPAGPRNYRMLAEVLAGSMAEEKEPRRRAIEIGRSWGRQQAAAYDAPAGADHVGRLVGMLDELGFEPERTPQAAGDERIGLRHCPFLELAETRSDIVCPIHLGLMQGAVEAWEAPMTIDRLDPFVEPDLCVAVLAGGRTD